MLALMLAPTLALTVVPIQVLTLVPMLAPTLAPTLALTLAPTLAPTLRLLSEVVRVAEQPLFQSVLHTLGLCSMVKLHRAVPTLFPLLLQDWSWRCSKHATVVCRHAFLQSLVFVRYI